MCLLSIGTAVLADGILLPVERPGTFVIVPDRLFTVKYHHVDVDIDNQLCTTKVDQIFHNDTGVEQEGMYVFPMPEGSAITEFSMYAGEQEIYSCGVCASSIFPTRIRLVACGGF
jgi:Ca-activated chloride channel family protein